MRPSHSGLVGSDSGRGTQGSEKAHPSGAKAGEGRRGPRARTFSPSKKERHHHEREGGGPGAGGEIADSGNVRSDDEDHEDDDDNDDNDDDDSVYALHESRMLQLLRDVKSSPINHYQKLWGMNDVELTVTPEAMEVIVGQAQMTKAGHGGIRTILEKLLFYVKFILQTEMQGKGIKAVEITEDAVLGKAPPNFKRYTPNLLDTVGGDVYKAYVALLFGYVAQALGAVRH